MPLMIIELKNSNIPVKSAYDPNLQNYLKDIPYLDDYNQIYVFSNGMETRFGSRESSIQELIPEKKSLKI